MEEFLKQLNLSEKAVLIYLESLGRYPLTYSELYSMVSDLSSEEFENTLNELVNIGILIPVNPQNPKILSPYFAIPPFNPIMNYFANIDANLDSIKNQLHQLLANSLKRIFQENELIELETTFNTTQEIRKDFEEETIIQKQDIDDIVQGMENLKIIKEVLDNLHQTIKGITQTQFANLIKTITNIKTEIYKNLETLELKKMESRVKSTIEDVFKKSLDRVVKDFTTNLHDIIENEFNNTIESLNNIVDSSFQFRDDFKMLLVNMLNNFEIKINEIAELVKVKRDNLSSELANFEQSIVNNFDKIIRNSVDSVAALNKPVNDVMKKYFQAIDSYDMAQNRDLWFINTSPRIPEELSNLISNSTNNLLIILPKLENFLNLEDFQKITAPLKIKIASSEASTNSFVKKFKGIKNLEYKTLKNENIVILKGDENCTIVGVIQNINGDSVNKFIGFGTDYPPLIKLLDPLVKSTWGIASSDLHQTPKSIGIEGPKITQTMKQAPTKPFKLKSTPQFQDIGTKPQFRPSAPTIELPKLKEVKETSIKAGVSDKPSEVAQKLQQQVSFTSRTTPKAGDEAGFIINNAFSSLIQKLSQLKGEEFSQELQKVADLILETKGFSVTLHKLRSTINKYKLQINMLSENDINQIIAEIEEWKKHLL